MNKPLSIKTKNKCKGKKCIKEDWSYFDKFEDIEDKYLPSSGEGDTMATQIVTAVCKLVYKFFNDGDVFDNTHYLDGGANDLSSYANWLYKYVPKTQYTLDLIKETDDEDGYEELLQLLADLTVDEEFLKEYNKPKEGTIYDCDGPFKYVDIDEKYDDEEYESLKEDINDDIGKFEEIIGEKELWQKSSSQPGYYTYATKEQETDAYIYYDEKSNKIVAKITVYKPTSNLDKKDTIDVDKEYSKEFTNTEKAIEWAEKELRKTQKIKESVLKENKDDVLSTNIKDIMTEWYPDEFQLDRIKSDITIGDVIRKLANNEDIYTFASVDGRGFDSAVREEIFTIISEKLKLPYDDIYNLWLDGVVSQGLRKYLKTDKNELLKEDEKHVSKHGDYEIIKLTDRFGNSKYVLLKNDEFVKDSLDYNELHKLMYDESLTEDTIKQNGKWVNKGKEGTHGKFKTKKQADVKDKTIYMREPNKSINEDTNTYIKVGDRVKCIKNLYWTKGGDRNIGRTGLVVDVFYQGELPTYNIVADDKRTFMGYDDSSFLAHAGELELLNKHSDVMEALSDSLGNMNTDYDVDYDEWIVVDDKPVRDSDGFWTDYVWYTNKKQHIFMFGDSEIYTPDESYADYVIDICPGKEKEAYEEAKEWFDNYDGFNDKDELEEDIDELIQLVNKATKLFFTQVNPYAYYTNPFDTEKELEDAFKEDLQEVKYINEYIEKYKNDTDAVEFIKILKEIKKQLLPPKPPYLGDEETDLE